MARTGERAPRRAQFLREDVGPFGALEEAAKQDSAKDAAPEQGFVFECVDGGDGPGGLMQLQMEMALMKQVLRDILGHLCEAREEAKQGQGCLKVVIGHIDALEDKVARLELQLQHPAAATPVRAQPALRIPPGQF